MSPDERLTISVADTGSKLDASGALGPLLLAYNMLKGNSVLKKLSVRKTSMIFLFCLFIIIMSLASESRKKIKSSEYRIFGLNKKRKIWDFSGVVKIPNYQ